MLWQYDCLCYVTPENFHLSPEFPPGAAAQSAAPINQLCFHDSFLPKSSTKNNCHLQVFTLYSVKLISVFFIVFSLTCQKYSILSVLYVFSWYCCQISLHGHVWKRHHMRASKPISPYFKVFSGLAVYNNSFYCAFLGVMETQQQIVEILHIIKCHHIALFVNLQTCDYNQVAKGNWTS